MSGRDDCWDVKIARTIMWTGLICIGGFAAAWLVAGIVWLFKFHPYVGLTLGIISWVFATLWYGINQFRIR